MNRSSKRYFRQQKKKASHRPRSEKHAAPNPIPRAKMAPSGVSRFVEGALQLKGRVGFVLSEDPKLGDVLIQGTTLRLAMNGDRVRAKVTSPPEAERRSGEIVQVMSRAHQTLVGTFQRRGNLPVLVPLQEGPEVQLLDLQSLVPHVGDVITARIRTWPTAKSAATGVLAEIIGPRDAPGVDLQTLIRAYELPDAFPDSAVAEAEHFGTEVSANAWSGRKTLFDQRVVTIDGADAKDFDDAVSLEKTPYGWKLGVHIADVAHYVRENSALDQEAFRRGTSVYLSGTVLPMLPFPLSDNLCSLRPDVVRLSLSCVMQINPEGRVVDAEIFESAIRSARRFTYDEVEQILRGHDVANVMPEIRMDIQAMGELARLVRRNRFVRGSLDFDFPEPDVITDLKGRPVNIQRRERLESHRLIEDFMLLANETVATHMKSHPFLYRIHETPDPTKMEKLQKSLKILGVEIPRHIDASHPSALQQVIKTSEGTPIQPLVHVMILRSLKQAVYSPSNKGHYGLASACYTHFTSPIRRYPDLIVHRIVKERLHQQYREGVWKKELPGIAAHTSKRERIAVDAEREYLDIQKVRLMESRVGETFTGIISAVTNFGVFVQLDEFFVEGLVHVTTLGNDYYIFDEARMTLRGRRTGYTFAIGQKVTVQLAKADIAKHQLDFQLISKSSPNPLKDLKKKKSK